LEDRVGGVVTHRFPKVPDDQVFGNRWGDATGSVRQVKKNGFVAEQYRDTGHEMEFVKHNLDATMTGELPIDHDWDLDTQIVVHGHCLPMANAGGNVYWTWQYYFSSLDIVVPAVAGWTTGNTTTTFVAGDQYKHTHVPIITFTPSGANAGAIIVFDITRKSTDVLDTYDTDKDHETGAANLGILYIDAHYQHGRAGTETELV
jgi:hypothetical protein